MVTRPATVRRFPSRVYGHGVEPDPRFSLANERTFLAWIRTALATVAGGVALAAIDLPIHSVAKKAAAVLLLGIGATSPLLAWFHWGASESAMRRGEPLPAFRLTLPLAVVVLIAATLLFGGVLIAVES
jgi:putative membrane protein